MAPYYTDDHVSRVTEDWMTQANNESMQAIEGKRREAGINNGFWDLPAGERGEAYDAAERDTGTSFFDLPAEERARYYDRFGRD